VQCVPNMLRLLLDRSCQLLGVQLHASFFFDTCKFPASLGSRSLYTYSHSSGFRVGFLSCYVRLCYVRLCFLSISLSLYPYLHPCPSISLSCSLALLLALTDLLLIRTATNEPIDELEILSVRPLLKSMGVASMAKGYLYMLQSQRLLHRFSEKGVQCLNSAIASFSEVRQLLFPDLCAFS
jgi:hypothetical protein